MTRVLHHEAAEPVQDVPIGSSSDGARDSDTVRAVNILEWLVRIALGLAALTQALALAPAIGRLRGSESATRSKARLDLLEIVGSLLSFSGLLLGSVVTGFWYWLALAGFAIMTPVYALKGVHWLRARRRSTA